MSLEAVVGILMILSIGTLIYAIIILLTAELLKKEKMIKLEKENERLKEELKVKQIFERMFIETDKKYNYLKSELDKIMNSNGSGAKIKLDTPQSEASQILEKCLEQE